MPRIDLIRKKDLENGILSFYYQEITAGILDDIKVQLSQNPNLHTLKFKTCPLGSSNNHTLAMITELLSQFSHVDSLIFEWTPFSDDEFKTIENIISQNHSLKKLSLKYCTNFEDKLENILKALEGNFTLTTLDIMMDDNSSDTAEAINLLLQRNKFYQDFLVTKLKIRHLLVNSKSLFSHKQSLNHYNSLIDQAENNLEKLKPWPVLHKQASQLLDALILDFYLDNKYYLTALDYFSKHPDLPEISYLRIAELIIANISDGNSKTAYIHQLKGFTFSSHESKLAALVIHLCHAPESKQVERLLSRLFEEILSGKIVNKSSFKTILGVDKVITTGQLKACILKIVDESESLPINQKKAWLQIAKIINELKPGDIQLLSSLSPLKKILINSYNTSSVTCYETVLGFKKDYPLKPLGLEQGDINIVSKLNTILARTLRMKGKNNLFVTYKSAQSPSELDRLFKFVNDCVKKLENKSSESHIGNLDYKS